MKRVGMGAGNQFHRISEAPTEKKKKKKKKKKKDEERNKRHNPPGRQHITKTSLFKYTENFTSKVWKFSRKKSDIFHISPQNIDCGEPPRGSNEYPQSMFLSRNKKNNV